MEHYFNICGTILSIVFLPLFIGMNYLADYYTYGTFLSTSKFIGLYITLAIALAFFMIG